VKTRIFNGKQQVFCEWRKKYVRLTPEEWVRQNFLHRLVDEFDYPANLIAVEVALEGKRADAVVYTLDLQPLMLIEFKAETVALTQSVLDQATVYNRQLHVPYLILHNGPQTIIARVTETEIVFSPEIPNFAILKS